MNELLTSGILEKGRKLKISAGEDYFEPIAMVAFTRFSFLMRRVFFRLMHQDLNTILDGLRELEARGVSTLDCRSAQFSADEPVTRLRMICQSWKVMFHAEYSSGSPLRMLVDLRNVVDAALSRTPKKAETFQADASSAGGGSGQGSGSGRAIRACELPALRLPAQKGPSSKSTAAPEWDQDSSASTMNRETTRKIKRSSGVEYAGRSSFRRVTLQGHARSIRERRAELGSVHGIDNFRRR